MLIMPGDILNEKLLPIQKDGKEDFAINESIDRFSSSAGLLRFRRKCQFIGNLDKMRLYKDPDSCDARKLPVCNPLLLLSMLLIDQIKSLLAPCVAWLNLTDQFI